MSGFVPKSFDSPEEDRPCEDIKVKLDLINIEGGPIDRCTFAGRRRSKPIK